MLADLGAVLNPAKRCDRLVRGVGTGADGWDSSMVEMCGGGTLKGLICVPFPREAKLEPGTPREPPLLREEL